MNPEILKNLYANAIGELVIRYLETIQPEVLPLQVESKALELIAQIKSILDDETLDDPACFFRIDALVNAFHARCILTPRHDW